MPPALSREQLLDALQSELEPLPFTLALWESGSAAFDRVDEYSDLDVSLVVEDERVEQGFSVVENLLEKLGGIAVSWRVPEPTWHGHSQTFYQLQEASPWLMLDLCIQRGSAPDPFLQPELHGQARFLFEKTGRLSVPQPLEPAPLKQRLEARRHEIQARLALFSNLPLKQLRRGHALEADQFYQGMVLRPLVELLRIQLTPARHAFHTRHIHHDFPSEILERLEPLFFYGGPGELEKRYEQALAWCQELLNP